MKKDKEFRKALDNIIVKNTLIVTMDKKCRIVRNGAIAIQNRAIADVGKTSDIVSRYKAEKITDAPGHKATAGLIKVAEEQIRSAVEERDSNLRKRIGIAHTLSWPVI